MNDKDLLTAFVAHGAHDAFAEIVRRHVGLVYATAFRQVRDPATAQEISQQVFCALARKAGSVRDFRSLPAWLHRTSHQLSALHIRSEQRRNRREHLAAMNLHEHPSEERPEAMEAWLDQALETLGGPDRTVLLLRYFESRPIAQVGAALGISEAAAKMRIRRALDKLRLGYARYGMACTAASLGVFLEDHARASAPDAVTAVVLAVTRGLRPEPIVAGWGLLGAFRRVGIPLAAAAVVTLGGWWGVSRWRVPSQTPAAATSVGDSEVTPSTDTAASTKPSPADAGADWLRLTLVDAETDVPLEGVSLRAENLAGSTGVAEVRTGADGTAVVPRWTGPGDFFFRITARLDGYASQWLSWSRFQRDAPADVPTHYILRMARGIRIGGVVRDASGRPIEGATVSLQDVSRWMGAPPRERGCLEDGGEETVTTDDKGRWAHEGLPADWSRLRFSFAAPDFQDARFITDTNDRAEIGAVRISTAELLAETSVVRLTPGWPVVGRVVDLHARPVPGARVVQDQAWGVASRWMDTAADGLFEFRNLSKGGHTVTVQAPGFAATAMGLDIPGSSNVVVRLLPGNVVRGRVVDEAGNPVLDAEVQLASSPKEQAEFWLRLKTDAEGRFGWDQAPNSELTLSLYRFGFAPETVAVPADGSETLIVLKTQARPPTLRVTGKVLDAETGAPVGRFRVLVGSDGEVEKQGEAGAFAFATLGTEDSIEIRAPGYKPARQDILRDDSSERSLEFRLNPAHGWSGQVLLPTGQPAAGAEVALMTPHRMPTLGNRRFLYRDQATVVTADAEGSFAFDPELPEIPSGRMLVAVHQEGYAELDADTARPGQVLTLHPWGRIQGLVRGRSTYPADLKVHVLARSWNPWMVVPLDPSHFSTQPDEQGRFILESVPPGCYSVGLLPHGAGAIDQRLTFRVLPGRTTSLDLPDDGAMVTGRLSAPGLPPEFDFTHSTAVLERRQESPVDLPRIRRKNYPSDEAYQQAERDQTPKLMAYWRSSTGLSAWMEQRSYAVQLRPDGSWAGRAIPPGDYDLKVAARERPWGAPFGGRTHHLRSVNPLRIEPTLGERPGDAVDLGPVPLDEAF